MIVGIRRRGELGTKLTAALVFFCGGLVIALFTVRLANNAQAPAFDGHAWDESFDQLARMLLIAIGFPLAFAVLLFMLRSWIWSAHDQALRRQR